MANQEHLDILKQGVETWNQWRKENANIKPDLSGAILSVANLGKANLKKARLIFANLKGANLGNATLSGADLRFADLYRANLIGANFIGANLGKANLSFADIMEANLSSAILFGTDLSGANLLRANLREAILREAILREAHLSWTNLSGTDLREAILREAHFYRATLRGADLRRADLEGTNLNGADLEGANLEGANLSQTTFVQTNLTAATLKECSIYGISAWDLKLQGAIQENLIITPHGEPAITVDNLKIAQFIYLLLNNQELRDVLNAVTEKGVLLLGRFSDGGLEILQSIAAELRKVKYLPMLFDFERPDSRNYTETVKVLVGLARFVIVDLSGPSVPQELYATIPHFKIPFVPIVEKRRKIYSMFLDLLEYPWVLKPVLEFENKDHLIELLPSRVIAPAEEKFKERQVLLQQLFNR